MSREIKFRAWNGKSMCYGGFSIHATGKIMSDGCERSLAGLPDGDFPVMQYTGIKDKNGTEIYEDDILSWHETDYRYRVVYDENTCGFMAREIKHNTYYVVNCTCEVFGNIYEPVPTKPPEA